MAMAAHVNSFKGKKPYRSYSNTTRSRIPTTSKTRHNGTFHVKDPFCKICHKPGHLSRDCWHKGKNKGYFKGSQRAFANYASGSDDSSQEEEDPDDYSNDEREDDEPLQAYTSTLISSSSLSRHWILDTGATHHLTFNRDWLTNYHPLSQPLEVSLGDSGTCQALGHGTATITLPNSTKIQLDKIYYVHDLTKNLISVSTATSHGTSITFHHSSCIIKHTLPSGHTLNVECPKLGRLYILGTTKQPISAHATELSPQPEYDTLLWHYRLGHLNTQSMQKIHHQKLAQGFHVPQLTNISLCEGCIYGKMANKPFSASKTSSDRLLQLVHSDLCGPIPTKSLMGHQYFLTFFDDYSRFTIVSFMKSKSEVFTHFKAYHTLVENQLDCRLKSLQTDNGGEFTSQSFISYCIAHGIHHHLTVPYHPQQNGVAERKNRTLLDASRCMLRVANLKDRFWADAVATACYLQNRTYHRTVNTTPYYLWFKRKPDYTSLRVFGSPAYCYTPPQTRTKLDARALKAIFIGYGEPHGVKGFRFYNPAKNQVFFSRHAIFDEDSLISSSQPVHSNNQGLPSPSSSEQSADHHDSVFWEEPDAYHVPAPVAPPLPQPAPPLPPPIAPPPDSAHQPYTPVPNRPPTMMQAHRSRNTFTRLSYSPHHMRPHATRSNRHVQAELHSTSPMQTNTMQRMHYTTFVTPTLTVSNSFDSSPEIASSRTRSLTDLYSNSERIDALLATVGQPASLSDSLPGRVHPSDDAGLTVEDALRGPDAEQWQKAMDTELEALCQTSTWTLMPLPPGRKAISCKWILRRKLNSDGSVARYKARLVARGFSQVEGLDYSETFSPVLRMSSFRVLMALTAALNLEVHHMDVQTAFLHGDLPEEIYMKQPPFRHSTTHPLHVCHLHRSLYGLKQSPRLWYHRFNSFMLSSGYTRLTIEPNIYIRHTSHHFLIVALYVDDIPLIASDLTLLQKAKFELSSVFRMTDLGPLTYFLGIQVTRDRTLGTVTLSQSKFVTEILEKYGMSNCKPVNTPLPVSHKLSLSDCPTAPADRDYMTQFPYCQVLGSIRYLVTSTRPDLCFAAGFLSRFMQNPGLPHWKALKRLLRYLAFSQNVGLMFSSHQSLSQLTALLGWSDSDWGGNVDTRRSTAGFVFLLAGAVVTWQAKKQNSVTLSTAEAEYVGVALATKEGIWLQMLISELNVTSRPKLKIFCDNMSCITLASNPRHSERTKHVDLKYHFIRELIEAKKLELEYTPTEMMWADFLTKPTPQKKHDECCTSVGLVRITT